MNFIAGYDNRHEKTLKRRINLLSNPAYLKPCRLSYGYGVWNKQVKIKIMNKTNVAIGVLAGVAVGALLGVLFAPDKGSETRKKLSRKATDTADEVKDKFDALLEEFTEKFEAAKAEASQMYDRGRRKVEEFRKDEKSPVS